MVQVSLIGIQTSDYESIKHSLMAYSDIHSGKIRVVEVNDLEKIISSAHESIPVVMVGKKKVYFNESRMEQGFEELRILLTERLKHTKAHSCKNCGNCSCPADQQPKSDHLGTIAL